MNDNFAPGDIMQKYSHMEERNFVQSYYIYGRKSVDRMRPGRFLFGGNSDASHAVYIVLDDS